MATYSKYFLSGGSGSGLPITVNGTATASATLLHTATSSANTTDAADEIWLWAGNLSPSPATLSLYWGDLNRSSQIPTTVPAFGGAPVLIAAGWPLQNGLIARATASAAGVLNVWGYVNRVS